MSAQTVPAGVTANSLNFTWQIGQNLYEKKSQSISYLTLKTGPDFALPAKGWKLYFNMSRRMSGTITPGLAIKIVKGHFYSIEPQPGFKGVAKNDSLRIQIITLDWVVNITDAPGGLFLAWDNAPQQTYPFSITSIASTQPQQYMRTSADKVAFTTPADIYKQNQFIKSIPADSLVKIFPTPYSYKTTAEQFKLNKDVIVNTDPAFSKQATFLKLTLNKVLKQNLSRTISIVKNNINLVKKEGLAPEEYELTVNTHNITIAAATEAGIFYGLQSFKMLLPVTPPAQNISPISIQGVEVKDKPRFEHRAVMLDVARNFQTKQQVLKLIDLMALYKMNKLRMHVTDDEGWRLEIPALPELTTYGARRGFTTTDQFLPPAYGSGADVNNPSGSGYYTRAEYITILKYAADRNIEVITEIESPGHARAAVKAMDFRYDRLMKAGQKAEAEKYLLHDRNDQSTYNSVQGFNDNVIDASMPSAYTFLSAVTDEIVSMYREANAPLKTIHMGGDEVPAGAWEKSPSVLALLKKDPSLPNVDALWTYYYAKVNDILKQRNLYLTAWEEVGTQKKLQNGAMVSGLNDAMLNKDVHLEVWNNVTGWGAEDLAYKLANSGYKVILSCVTNMYFDMAYHKDFYEPGYYWGGYIDVDQPYSFIPLDYLKNMYIDRLGLPVNQAAMRTKEKPTEAGKANIVGIQGALWAETIKGPKMMEYLLLPKMMGLAERAWAQDPAWALEADSARSAALYNTAFNTFLNQLGKRELPRLDTYAGGFGYRIPQPGAVIVDGKVVANSKYPGFTIRYTTDGSVPTSKSAIYSGPIAAKGAITLCLFNVAGRAGRSVSIVN
ncbi:family 20 glycosylhydrolase [Mucilaginibacter gynuensis]|uniref:beta-N-acetylhexosaminidase n=1 Tax=Mucilaginibacter gynuensis TaxID=1302236 RepID=A0ABP8GHF8_9SPHI